MSDTFNKIIYVAQTDEFVTGTIANVVILTRLNENVSKIPFLDVSISNFLLDENINIFLLEKNVSNLFWTYSTCLTCPIKSGYLNYDRIQLVFKLKKS